jgi:hypothetical protein
MSRGKWEWNRSGEEVEEEMGTRENDVVESANLDAFIG